MQNPAMREAPFDTAPALYAYNVPRFYTVMLRARQYARANNTMLHWFIAQDIPLHVDDRQLQPQQLYDKRRRWLTAHDQETSHIASTVPLVYMLPIRFTDAVDRDRQLFRERRGNIRVDVMFD